MPLMTENVQNEWEEKRDRANPMTDRIAKRQLVSDTRQGPKQASPKRTQNKAKSQTGVRTQEGQETKRNRTCHVYIPNPKQQASCCNKTQNAEPKATHHESENPRDEPRQRLRHKVKVSFSTHLSTGQRRTTTPSRSLTQEPFNLSHLLLEHGLNFFALVIHGLSDTGFN